ncbi:MAG: DUF4097 family beta strand repeat-containing protein [Dehalococcoidia bacterium]|nr:DUF4097 family beta strand repeat-containing protein [Dehalococcoidia bacterium]
MRLTRVILLVIAAMLLLTACREGARGAIDRRFAVEGPVTLVVEVDDADVTIGASLAGAVVVTGSYDADRYEQTATADGAVVRVQVLRERSLLSLVSEGGAELTVRVPPGTAYRVQADETNVTIEAGPIGGGTIETGNGSVTVLGGDGAVTVRNGDGPVMVEGQHGALDLRTSGADVTVTGHRGGPVTIETSNGAVRYYGTIEPDSSNELTTTNSSVTVRLTGQPSLLLDAETTAGVISSRYAVLEPVRGPGVLRGRIAGGGATLRIRTSNGPIDIGSADVP